MYIVLAGTGQVGSAVARALLRRGEPATVVTRDEKNAASLQQAGAEVAVANIRDVARLREVFGAGRRAFLLNPPADPSGDTDAEERANVDAIVEALDGSGLEKVVAASTYGARAGERCGDLTVLYEFEQKLRAQSIPAAVNRAAYYMSNWAGMLEAVREGGKLPSFFPADFVLPMVAPDDLGEAAAERLLSPVGDIDVRYVEGPERYTPADVANAIADTFGLSVELEVVPREAWQSTFLQLGFSEEAAESYACMTAAVVEGEGFQPDNPDRGTTSLRDYIGTLNRE
ncbi:NmrA family transcriptional regulator [Pelagivirga sediminicola]|uniref:NmrA family transcriptional regulator n=1 Tax=Pelagivirga sediminicola TaxID=2170575 RepID=A0A2T7G2L0_9RHOB|nr:NmrA family NAD(P)-binding protein [Pelagivirga sediminicola]PVA08659.1 NmrA family transcriptional regulator [Pelagivirga sediminicola]